MTSSRLSLVSFLFLALVGVLLFPEVFRSSSPASLLAAPLARLSGGAGGLGGGAGGLGHAGGLSGGISASGIETGCCWQLICPQIGSYKTW